MRVNSTLSTTLLPTITLRGFLFFGNKTDAYQPREGEKGDLVADSDNIMARWRNSFSQLLNVHKVKDVRQAEIQTIESLVPEPSAFEIELAIEKLKNHKSRGSDQIPAELFKAGSKTVLYEIHRLIISIWNKEELPEEWKESIVVPIYTKGNNIL